MKTRILILLPFHPPQEQAALFLSEIRSTLQHRTDLDVTLFSDLDANQLGDSLRQSMGPGGYRKIAFRHAIDAAYDFVFCFDAQPTPIAPSLLQSLTLLQSDSKIASLLMQYDQPRSWFRKGWQRFLSLLLNKLSNLKIQFWHASSRAYRTSALKRIAFELNTTDAHFDTEVLLQLSRQGEEIQEMVCAGEAPGAAHFPSWSRAFQSMKAALRYRLQSVNLFYDLRFHPEIVFGADHAAPPARHYDEKFQSFSPHSFVCSDPNLIPAGSRVLDLGCSSGYVARRLSRERGCQVTGIDLLPPDAIDHTGFTYIQANLETDGAVIDRVLAEKEFDVVLMLDVLEHLSIPELFLLRLYRRPYAKAPRFVFSTGNVAFIVIRLMLSFGYFNYGNKGILDITHKRLFSARTFKNLLDQTGFMTHHRVGFPLPYRELNWPASVCQVLEKINSFLIRLRFNLFSYQILVIATPLSQPKHVLQDYLAKDLGFQPHRVTS